MPKLVFRPIGREIEVDSGTKVLAAALKNKIAIRYGCASCRCGTCGVKVSGQATVKPMEDQERALLARMKLPVDGSIRLACRTRIESGELEVDLDFQNAYTPEDDLDEFLTSVPDKSKD